MLAEVAFLAALATDRARSAKRPRAGCPTVAARRARAEAERCEEYRARARRALASMGRVALADALAERNASYSRRTSIWNAKSAAKRAAERARIAKFAESEGR